MPIVDRKRRRARRAVAKLDEIPRRDTWIPVRDQLDIGAFGVNAYRADEAGGSGISDHNELLAKHEELYVVVEGHAAFTVDGTEIDAPEGTLVFVREPATRRSAVAKVAPTTILVTGACPGVAYEVSPWEHTWEENRAAMKLYREERPPTSLQPGVLREHGGRGCRDRRGAPQPRDRALSRLPRLRPGGQRLRAGPRRRVDRVVAGRAELDLDG